MSRVLILHDILIKSDILFNLTPYIAKKIINEIKRMTKTLTRL